MITRLTVSNFRSLGENVRVPFNRFTALVGPNGSGKSNVVDALRFVSDAMHMGLSGAITDRHGIQAVRRWSAGHPYNVAIQLELALGGGTASYGFVLRGDAAEEYSVKQEEAEILIGGARHRFRVEAGKWIEGPEGLRPTLDPQSLALPLVGGDARFERLVHALQRIALYAIFPDALRVPQKYSPVKPMERHGSNWAAILKDQPKETWKPDLVEALRKLTGDIEDIRVQQAASYLVVQFEHSTEGKKARKWFDSAQESDGTLRMAGIITALLQDPPLPVVGVEEPELTVHPGAIGLLYDYLAQAAKRSQVIVTTHSPELLDRLDAEDVRVVRRVEGTTTVGLMAEHQRDAVKSGLMTLGDVLRTEGIAQQELPLPPVAS